MANFIQVQRDQWLADMVEHTKLTKSLEILTKYTKDLLITFGHDGDFEDVEELQQAINLIKKVTK